MFLVLVAGLILVVILVASLPSGFRVAMDGREDELREAEAALKTAKAYYHLERSSVAREELGEAKRRVQLLTDPDKKSYQGVVLKERPPDPDSFMGSIHEMGRAIHRAELAKLDAEDAERKGKP